MAIDPGFAGDTDDYGVESPCLVKTPGGYVALRPGSDRKRRPHKSAPQRDDGTVSEHDAIRVVATEEAARFIKRAGGMLFVWPSVSRSFRLTLTVLHASCDPPPRALEFRRLDAGNFLLFLHPAIGSLPSVLQLGLKGRRHPRVEAYWNGLAYVI